MDSQVDIVKIRNMYYVYIIQSIITPNKLYVGFTSNIDARLAKHNEGGSVYTKDYRPWKLIWHSSFQERSKALDFEKYLKTYSGKVFMQKRLI